MEGILLNSMLQKQLTYQTLVCQFVVINLQVYELNLSGTIADEKIIWQSQIIDYV